MDHVPVRGTREMSIARLSESQPFLEQIVAVQQGEEKESASTTASPAMNEGLQSVLKTPTKVLSESSSDSLLGSKRAKRVSWSPVDIIIPPPYNCGGDEQINSTTGPYSPPADKLPFTKQSFHRHRRMSGHSIPSPLGPGFSANSVNSDASGLVFTPSTQRNGLVEAMSLLPARTMKLQLTPSAGRQNKRHSCDSHLDQFWGASPLTPSTPSHGQRGNYGSMNNKPFGGTPGPMVSSPLPAGALFSPSASSKVYTTDQNDPFAERQHASSPTVEAYSSSYASDRPQAFEQYLGNHNPFSPDPFVEREAIPSPAVPVHPPTNTTNVPKTQVPTMPPHLQPFCEPTLNSPAFSGTSIGPQYKGANVPGMSAGAPFLTGQPFNVTSTSPHMGVHSFNGTSPVLHTGGLMGGQPCNGTSPGPQMGGQPFNGTSNGLQFVSGHQFNGTWAGPQYTEGPKSANVSSSPHSSGGSFFNASNGAQFMGGNFTGRPTGRPDLPLPPPPLVYIPQTPANRTMLDARKPKREEWIRSEARKMRLLWQTRDEALANYNLTFSPEALQAHQKAQDELSSAWDGPTRHLERRQMFPPAGAPEPLRTGPANIPADGFAGSNGAGQLLGSRMATMEKVAHEAAFGHREGAAAATTDGLNGKDSREVRREMIDSIEQAMARRMGGGQEQEEDGQQEVDAEVSGGRHPA